MVLLLFSCSSAGSQTGQGFPPPGPPARTLVLVSGSGDSLLTARLQAWTQSLSSRNRRFQATFITDDQLLQTDLSNTQIVYVGNPQTNKAIAQIADQLPVLFAPDYFSLGQSSYKGDGFVCVLSRSPSAKSEQTMSAILANRDEDSLHFLENNPFAGRFGLPLGQWDFQVFKNNKRIRMGNFSENGKPDGPPHWNFEDQDKPVLASTHFRFFVHTDTIAETTVQRWLEACEKKWEELRSFTLASPTTVIDYHLYGSAQNQGLITGRMEQNFPDFGQNEVHALANQDYMHNLEAVEVRLFLRQIKGEPATLALEEGLSVWFSPQWQKKGFAYWASRLYESNNLVSLSQILNNEDFLSESPVVRGAMAGAFVDFLISLWGKDEFLLKYSEWNPSPEDISSLEPMWLNYLHTHFVPANPPSYTRPGFQKGMTFAHEGYGIYNGYGSEMAHESLSRLQSLGTNAISIVPYTGTRDTQSPSSFGFSQFAGGENDASVIHTFYAAKRMGMNTMLKPQVWVRGGWPGDLEMKNEADWQIFFREYRKWIRHYALLAEIHEMDIFCVGVEFVKATTSHPEEWRNLIADIRKIYHGPVTYAANWGEEFDKLAFADALDFIGIDCYYPLSSKKNASKAELRDGFRKVVEHIENISQKKQKPVVFTEIGFRSIESPWLQPHAYAGESPYEETGQALCYQVVFETLQNKPWFMGMYWWKWPSYLDHTQRDPTDYNPFGKKAEEVLEKFY
ncbi:MAG: hypothetical protein R3C61_14040 [Bacteroidia bacterium]